MGPQQLCSKGSFRHRQTQMHRWVAQPCPLLHSTDWAGACRASGIKRLMAVAPWTLHFCWGCPLGHTSPACEGWARDVASPKSERWAQPSGHHSPAGGDGDFPPPQPQACPQCTHSQKMLMTVSSPAWQWLILESEKGYHSCLPAGVADKP